MNPLNRAHQQLLDEAPELLQEIENKLIGLQAHGANQLEDLLQAIQSLKQKLANGGLIHFTRAVHRLENLLKKLFCKNITIDTPLEGLLLEAFDCIAIPLRENLKSGKLPPPSQTVDGKIEEIWRQLEAKLEEGENNNGSHFDGASSDTDIVAELFRGDVARIIDNLRGLVAQEEGDSYQKRQQLLHWLDSLESIAQLTELPGFSLIVSIAKGALEKNPHQVATITSLLIEDLEKSLTAVLAGDRRQGGAPSSRLLALNESETPENTQPLEKGGRGTERESYMSDTVSIDEPMYELFMAEVPELLDTIEHGLLSLKTEKTTARVNEIMRAAHSLKGGAASVGLHGIKDLAHRLEDYVKALFSEQVVFDDELESLFLSAFDCLKNALLEQQSTGKYSHRWQEEAETVWAQLEAKLGSVEDIPDFIPSSSDLGVDMVKSLFEVEVHQIIQQLQEHLENTPTSELPVVVSPILDVLMGLGELGNEEKLKNIVNKTREDIANDNQKAGEAISQLIGELISLREKHIGGKAPTEETTDWQDLTEEVNNSLEEIEETGDITGSMEEQTPDFLSLLGDSQESSSAPSSQQSQQEELQAQSYQFFLEEAPELIALIDNNLERVFQSRNINEINEVARAAHSLKGGARTAGLEDLATIALRVEKSLKALFNENIPLDEKMQAYLREIYHLLREAVLARVEGRDFDEKTAAEVVNSKWAEFEREYGEEIAKAEEYLPSSSDLGVDIASSLFEIDVPQGIATLQTALETEDDATLINTVTSQLEVFTGFGEMLGLPGFVSICQTAQQALQQYPQRVREITSTLIENLQQAQAQVLAGDRTRGGEVSASLRAFLSTPASPTVEIDEKPVDTNDPAYGFFVEEAPELLQIIESGLLTLREERNTAKIHEMMRAAHSIKGGAASVGLEAIKTIAHQLEDIFKVLYNPEVAIDTELETWLLEGYDCLANALNTQIETGQYNPQEALARAEQVWAKIKTKLGLYLERADDYIPSSSDLGIDMVRSMFEVDVAQELDRLKAVTANPAGLPLAGELRATLEVFAGFGEMLNLPGFAEIAHLGLKAVELQPDQVINIINVVVRDVEKAREAVLKGDRKQGGQPSEELKRLAEGKSLVEAEEIPETSGDEVLGEVLATPEEIFPPIYRETQTVANPLSEVHLSTIEIQNLEKLDQGIPEEGEEENLPELEELLSATIEVDKSETIPSISEILAPPSEEEEKTEEISPQPPEELSEEVPSLEEVFGDISEIIKAPEETPPEETKAPAQPTIPESHKEEVIILSEAEREALLRAEGVEETVESITRIYEKLPPVSDIAQISPKKDDSSSKKPIGEEKIQETKTAPPTPKTNLTIRVDLERLERMNNLIGELSITRNSLSLQNEKLQSALRELLSRFSQFQQTANALRDLSDRMLVSPSRFTPGKGRRPTEALNLSSEEGEDTNLTAAFDVLEMDRYDDLYSVTQALLEQIIQLEEAVEDIALYASQSGQTVDSQKQMLNRLRDELMWARMLPLGEILNRFPRVLRDLSVKYNKKVNLKLSGTNVLVDKAALEKLYDPLVHLIRNAFDHGIETPELRRQRGKPEVGTIEVKAYHQGNQTIIEVRDDGGGINLAKVGQKAVEKGLLTPEQLAVISKENLLDLIFEPGFSTAPSVTEISGRGVGLDIVRSQLRSLKGTITVDSEEGKGTTFTLRLPLTLTIDKLLVLSAANLLYAVPSDNIFEILVPENHQLKVSANQRWLHYENRVIPLYSLAELLHYNCYLPPTNVTQSVEILPTPPEWNKPLLLIGLGQELFAIEVEHLVSEQELVVKPFGTAITAPKYTYGCTILGDGTLIPVINPVILISQQLQLNQPTTPIPIRREREEIPAPFSTPVHRNGHTTSTATVAKPFQIETILVVDDSAAMRRTLALSLEKAGYRVVQAKDGKDALEQLLKGLNVNLIICDIEMPNMNGFEFLSQRRRHPELSRIPVAMLTSRSNEKHRQLATHLGANAYFTKPYIEQKFLESIRNLLAQK
ncbi:MAG: Hpt domain-containing protein [Geminocystis sp.]|nr:Hpt domain-containing protein [Geminocystis sp.]MDW8115936.1 Hpt domain-containing protein [Geminocystis sp.]